ncbi:MAG: C1 family peptidase [Bacteroidetes bacterium]|nr:C1 family peptidase [Bacteroidota bacterium]
MFRFRNQILFYGILLLVFFGTGSCQNEEDSNIFSVKSPLKSLRKFGLTRTPADRLNQIKAADKKTYNGTIPGKYRIPTPPIEPYGQGNEGACVAWATSWAVASTKINYTGNTINYGNLFSPEFIYNQIKISNDCEQGSYFVSNNRYLGALDLVAEDGVCFWDEMPYSDKGCSVLPNSSQKSLAEANRISKYEKVEGFNTIELKKVLLANFVLVFGATVDEGFVSAGNNFIWKTQNGQNLGGHAMIIVGYDDAKNAFKIQNSWGNSWGDHGYGWLDYDYYHQVVFEAYILYK